ncbi:MAG: ribbon-helix-helix protein, CopG family [Rhodocyclaceae bacterium]|nr:MAG: ribbon-helix-helix protein, CopG family [Rhodocyclaceae bacterium]
MENTIAVRVSDETYARLREMAKAEELRVSDIVRRVLRESLKVSA